jgi:hypothetical protein
MLVRGRRSSSNHTRHCCSSRQEVLASPPPPAPDRATSETQTDLIVSLDRESTFSHPSCIQLCFAYLIGYCFELLMELVRTFLQFVPPSNDACEQRFVGWIHRGMQQHFLRSQNAPIADTRHVHLEAYELLGFLERVCASRTAFFMVSRSFRLSGSS